MFKYLNDAVIAFGSHLFVNAKAFTVKSLKQRDRVKSPVNT